MRFGLVTSMLFHGALLGWALFSVSATREFKTEAPVPIAVELLSVKDYTKIRKGDDKAKPEVKPEAKKDEPRPEAKDDAKTKRVAVLAPPKPPTPPEPAKIKTVEPPKPEEKKPVEKKDEPKADPIADQLKKLATETPEPKPEPKKDEPKKDEPKKDEPKKVEKKPEKKKPKDAFDPDKVAALLNKLPNAAAKPSSKADDAKKDKSTPALGIEDGQGDELTISEQKALIAQIISKVKGCWSPPVGAAGADAILVKVSFKLGRDGAIEGVPKILNRDSSPLFQLAEESAVRALMQCQPYDDLPAEKYDNGWKAVTLNFIPRDMFGG